MVDLLERATAERAVLEALDRLFDADLSSGILRTAQVTVARGGWRVEARRNGNTRFQVELRFTGENE